MQQGRLFPAKSRYIETIVVFEKPYFQLKVSLLGVWPYDHILNALLRLAIVLRNGVCVILDLDVLDLRVFILQYHIVDQTVIAPPQIVELGIDCY